MKNVDDSVLENANSMILNNADVQIDNDTIVQNVNKNVLHSDDLIIFDEKTNKKINGSKYIITNRDLLVYTYVIPNEIILNNNNAQDERILKASYIDLCISGCIDIGGKQFAKEFIISTYGWIPFLKYDDDRSNPFYSQYNTIKDDEINKIDTLLDNYAFNSI